MEKELQGPEEDDKTPGISQSNTEKVPIWKTPGPHGVRGFRF